jgi:hypothetical protein
VSSARAFAANRYADLTPQDSEKVRAYVIHRAHEDQTLDAAAAATQSDRKGANEPASIIPNRSQCS